jgi:hypothetical protein
MPTAMTEPVGTPAAAYAEQTGPEPFMAEEPVSMLSSVGEGDDSQAFEPRAVSYPLSGETTDAAMPGAMFDEVETAAEQEADSSAETTPRTGQITLDQLSPEAIDAIARRAVELLSAKVVEEVAWEVVPHLAELLIKRKLEEEKAQ